MLSYLGTILLFFSFSLQAMEPETKMVALPCKTYLHLLPPELLAEAFLFSAVAPSHYKALGKDDVCKESKMAALDNLQSFQQTRNRMKELLSIDQEYSNNFKIYNFIIRALAAHFHNKALTRLAEFLLTSDQARRVIQEIVTSSSCNELGELFTALLNGYLKAHTTVEDIEKDCALSTALRSLTQKVYTQLLTGSHITRSFYRPENNVQHKKFLLAYLFLWAKLDELYIAAHLNTPQALAWITSYLQEHTKPQEAIDCLCLAAEVNSTELALLALKNQADINGFQSLERAITSHLDHSLKAFEIYERPVQHTPLTLASLQGNKEMIQFLITSGASIKAKNRMKESPLLCAAKQGNKEVATFLLQHEALKPSPSSDLEFHDILLAIPLKNSEMVDFIIPYYFSRPNSLPKNPSRKKCSIM